ncbi:hypothetical protein HPP92_011273 [Vanilla planifolia]|uniref:Thump domain-containing protein n=1 Tax=Vanilla planifolia TaxID=51239 RepID=A0A835R244_VANPL|nr:hypothetical protein HPP92_011577 [Vanilla planifolia]KAG0483189.1 hypothetical protein HPP92_011273 [Vanilla planifolia]
MAAENKPASNSGKGKKRKFLPHCKPVKKGLYPLRPGVEGFFITCDGGRERQAANEALDLLDSFYEELVDGSDSASKCKRTIPTKPVNKITKFKDSDSSSDEESVAEDKDVERKKEELSNSKENKNDIGEVDSRKIENHSVEKEAHDTPMKKQCIEKDASARETTDVVIAVNKPIDERIDDELNELKDRNKILIHLRVKIYFFSYDPFCPRRSNITKSANA